MRTKHEILGDSLASKPKTPHWDTTASLHERLTIEVLIDIRDKLDMLVIILTSVEKIVYRSE